MPIAKITEMVIAPLQSLAGRPVNGPRTASVAHVSGLMRISHAIHACAPETGKNAPESIHIGMNTRFMTA